MIATFRGLKPFQMAEYICLMLFAFLLPMQIATYAMILLFIITVLRGIYEGGFKPNPIQYNKKIAYVIFVAFWLVYAISFFYSSDSAEATSQIGKKLSFVLFPIYFLCSNLSYLTKDRARTIMYIFVTGILILYAVNLVWAGYDVIFNDYDLNRIITYHKFFKKIDIIFPGIHRGYFSIITCIGLIFCFYELFTCKSRKLKIYDVILVSLFTISPFYVTSRAGMLCLICLYVILWIWLTFVLGKIKIGVITGFAILMMLSAGYFVFPKSIDRFVKAIDNVKNNKGDIRWTVVKASEPLMRDVIFFGVGAGDRSEETKKAYYAYRDAITNDILEQIDVDTALIKRKNDIGYCEYSDTLYKYIAQLSNKDKYKKESDIVNKLSYYRHVQTGISMGLNTHNQYADTVIAVGIAGLILLIGFFVVPICLWIKNKNFDILFFSFLFIFAFNCLFESVFERQMGIMPFVFIYFLLFHASFCQQSTDNGQQSLSTINYE